MIATAQAFTPAPDHTPRADSADLHVEVARSGSTAFVAGSANLHFDVPAAERAR